MEIINDDLLATSLRQRGKYFFALLSRFRFASTQKGKNNNIAQIPRRPGEPVSPANAQKSANLAPPPKLPTRQRRPEPDRKFPTGPQSPT